MQIDYQETHKDLQKRIDLHSQYGSKDIDAWMLDLLSPDKGICILDVACGAGKQLEAFHRYLGGDAEIIGGDVSKELLGQARALSAEMGGAFEAVELDFDRRFEFDDGEFDLVSCCFAIYYAEAIKFTVGEMHRVLRPDGRLFTTGPMPENKSLFYDVIRAATGAEIPPMPGSSRFASEILSEIRAHFSSTELHVFENPLVFKELDPFVEYVRASLSEDRKLWKGLFDSAGEFETVIGSIAQEADSRLQQEGELVMTKVVGGIVAIK
jgi:ubiquinone/menaquinone biosynthesis C-methylase UbiE